MRRRVSVFLFMLVSVTVTASLVSSNDLIVKVKADPEAVLAVFPPLSAPRNPGEILTILVNVTGVTDLFTWAFRLNWSIGLLQCLGVTEETSFFDGEFASSIGANYVSVGSTLTPPALGETGSGRLARLRFSVTDTGQTTFGLLETTMYNSTGGEISHTTEGGVFYTSWPRAVFTMSPDPRIDNADYGRPIANETVVFNATTSYDPDDPYDSTPGGITNYEWDFDYDGMSFDVEATGVTASHAYEVEGTYFPSLRVTDDEGDTDINTYPLEGLDIFYHDLAIIDVTIVNDPPEVRTGATAYVNATVLNQGTDTEYLNVTLYAWAGSTAYPVQTTVFEWIYIDAWGARIPRYTLTAGQSETTTIEWDTTGFPAGEYWLGVKAFIVTPPTHPTPRIALPGLEPEMADNEWADGVLTITGVTEHAIQVTSVAVSPTDIEFDEWADVKTTITNAGNVDEHLNLTVMVYYDSVVFKTEVWTNATIFAGGSRVFEFPLLKADDTADEGTYNVTASVYLVYPNNLTEIEDGITNDTLSALFQIQIYPVVDFMYSPSSPVVGQEILFDASDSYAPGANGGTLEVYRWDFGDGTLVEVTTPTITHVYRWSATFAVTLEVTDDVGLESTLTRTGLQGVKVTGTHDITISTVSFSPNSVTTGDTIEISVTIANTGSFSETFNVTTYYAETEISTQTNVTLTADAATTLTFQWSTTGVIGGDYAIKAYATNVTGETHVDDNVRIGGTATVEKLSSELTASATPTSITIGDMVTLDGAVSPGDAGIDVTIWYMLSGGTWSELATVATLTDGTYTYLWTPSEAGSYAVMASWAGDDLTMPSESAPVVVAVQEAPAPEIYLYTTGALAVVLVATIVYFVWMRKPKPT